MDTTHGVPLYNWNHGVDRYLMYWQLGTGRSGVLKPCILYQWENHHDYLNRLAPVSRRPGKIVVVDHLTTSGSTGNLSY